MIKKWIRRCICACLCAVFLMSHNASALNNQLLGDDYYLYAHTSGNPFCAENSYNASDRLQTLDTPFRLYNGEHYWFSCVDSNSASSTLSAVRGDVIVVELNTDFEVSPYWYNASARYLFSAYTNNIQTIYYYTDGFSTSVEFGWVYNSENFVGSDYASIRIQSINIYRPKASPPTYEGALNNINNNINNLNNGINNVNNSVNNLNDSVNNINDEEKSETQDAADNADASGDQSAADAQNATAGLTSVIGGFVSAITNATPTDCKINGQITGSFNMGELDLCAMPVPSFVQIISSLILIAICIPFAITMFNRFISLFRSFQG